MSESSLKLKGCKSASAKLATASKLSEDRLTSEYEVYEGHPMMAILTRNKKALLEILDNAHELPDLNIRDEFNLTMMKHLAAWPVGLKLVLEKFGPSFLQVYDQTEPSALEFGLHLSGSICPSHDDKFTRCPEKCPCADVVEMLLDSDENILARATSIWKGTAWVAGLMVASVKAQELVVDALKLRREELREFALIRLGPSQLDEFGLSRTDVLDQHAGDVLKALEARGFDVPYRLRTAITHHNHSASLYHLICENFRDLTHLLDIVHSRGFHDLDIPDSMGATPLTISDNTSSATWLTSHGAQLPTCTQAEKQTNGHQWVHHFVSRLILRRGCHLFKDFRGVLNQKAHLIPSRCRCSSGECYPYSTMWMYLLRARLFSSAYEFESACEEIHQICLIFEDGLTLPPYVKTIFLRSWTFAALELRHTCVEQSIRYHYVFGCDPESMKDDEIEDIHEEDAEELARLEMLLTEFESTIAQQECSLSELFITVWKKRMWEVRREIEAQILTGEELAAIRGLGVCLQFGDRNIEEEDATGSMMERSSYWMNLLDTIE